jgi:hypothetical protein
MYLSSITIIVLLLVVVERMVAFEFGTLRGIRSFVSSHAIVASVLDETVTDLLDKSVLVSVITHSAHLDWFYISGVGVSGLAYLTYHASSLPKLNELVVYRDSYKQFRYFIFILTIVFMKDLENAI